MALAGYNPNTSLLPSSGGAIQPMSGGGAPPGFNPDMSLLPSAGGDINSYRGGFINESVEIIQPTSYAITGGAQRPVDLKAENITPTGFEITWSNYDATGTYSATALLQGTSTVVQGIISGGKAVFTGLVPKSNYTVVITVGKTTRSSPLLVTTLAALKTLAPAIGATPTTGTPTTTGTPPTTGTPSATGTPPIIGTPSATGTPSVTGTPSATGTPPIIGTPSAIGTPPTIGTPSAIGTNKKTSSNENESKSKSIILFGTSVTLDNPKKMTSDVLTVGQITALQTLGLDGTGVSQKEKMEVLQALYDGKCNTETPLVFLQNCEPIRRIVQSLALNLLEKLQSTNNADLADIKKEDQPSVEYSKTSDGGMKICINFKPGQLGLLSKFAIKSPKSNSKNKKSVPAPVTPPTPPPGSIKPIITESHTYTTIIANWQSVPDVTYNATIKQGVSNSTNGTITDSGNIKTVTFNGLIPDTTYTITVTATKGGDTETVTKDVKTNAAPIAPITPIAPVAKELIKPTGLTSSEITSNSFKIRWATLPNPFNTPTYTATASTDGEEDKNGTISGNTASFTGLTSGKTYSVVVKSTIGTREELSDPLSITTITGTTPSGTTPSGTTPSGTTPSGTTPSGTTPSGTTPSGTGTTPSTTRLTPILEENNENRNNDSSVASTSSSTTGSTASSTQTNSEEEEQFTNSESSIGNNSEGEEGEEENLSKKKEENNAKRAVRAAAKEGESENVSLAGTKLFGNNNLQNTSENKSSSNNLAKQKKKEENNAKRAARAAAKDGESENVSLAGTKLFGNNNNNNNNNLVKQNKKPTIEIPNNNSSTKITPVTPTTSLAVSSNKENKNNENQEKLKSNLQSKVKELNNHQRATARKRGWKGTNNNNSYKQYSQYGNTKSYTRANRVKNAKTKEKLESNMIALHKKIKPTTGGKRKTFKKADLKKKRFTMKKIRA